MFIIAIASAAPNNITITVIITVLSPNNAAPPACQLSLIHHFLTRICYCTQYQCKASKLSGKRKLYLHLQDLLYTQGGLPPALKGSDRKK